MLWVSNPEPAMTSPATLHVALADLDPASLDPGRPLSLDTQRRLLRMLEEAACLIAAQEDALEEAGARIDALQGQLDAIARLLPPGVDRPLPDRVAGLLRALADAVELLDAETAREVPAATIRRRRVRLLGLLPRLGA
ncbi:MAG: hypothetical protein ACOZNI_29620, partial [Myxococcota bacterium]